MNHHREPREVGVAEILSSEKLDHLLSSKPGSSKPVSVCSAKKTGDQRP